MKMPVIITPGPKKPDMHSFIKPLADNLHELYNKGFDVRVGDKLFSVIVKPILCVGDSSAVSDAYQMKGSCSYYCCRYCQILGAKRSVSKKTKKKLWRDSTYLKDLYNI